MAAGLAAGLTETEAAEAAISSFGTVHAVARAHHTRRGRAAAAFVSLVAAIWLLVGTVLTSVFAVGLVMVVVIVTTGTHRVRVDAGQPSPGQLATFVVICGLLGLAMLGSYPRARRFLQRSIARR